MAQLLSVSPRTLRNWVTQRLIPFYKIKRVILFDPDDVDVALKTTSGLLKDGCVAEYRSADDIEKGKMRLARSMLIAEGASKKEACEKAGVAYSSFMRWQRQKRGLKRLIEEAKQMWRDNQRVERELAVLLAEKPVELNTRSRLHNRRPYRDPEAQPGQVDEADPLVPASSGSN